MAERTLSVRSSKAFDIAHRLAKRESRTVAEIVEVALEAYDAREPAAAFYRRLSAQTGAELELEQILQDAREPHTGIEL